MWNIDFLQCGVEIEILEGFFAFFFHEISTLEIWVRHILAIPGFIISTMGLLYVTFIMGLFNMHKTAYVLRCIEDDPEVITISMMYKVRLAYHLQSVPHPTKKDVTVPGMKLCKTCCKYTNKAMLKVQHNDDGYCHLLSPRLRCNTTMTVTVIC